MTNIKDLTEQTSPSPNDLLEIQQAADDFSRKATIRNVVESMQAANVPALTQTISSPPTQAQVNAIQTKVNDLLTALKASGLMEDDST
jgi:hypothetical protein